VEDIVDAMRVEMRIEVDVKAEAEAEAETNIPEQWRKISSEDKQ
jgi:hypothetical protein